MKSSAVALGLGAAAAVSAQRPADQSICDYYTTALLMENNATNQQTVLTLVVNTAVIGNYTSNPGSLVAVPGILAPGTGDFEGVNLLPYFNGELVSTNAGGMPRSVNFLDDGGAAPLMMNMPANGTDSAQYRLLTHLYQYFAVLLGCSQFGNSTGQYEGDVSQYSVHKYMGLNNAEVGYFITQVGLAAKSFGVTDDDVTAVGTALTNAFGYRCAPPAAIPPTASAELQAICIAEDCPIATESATCDAYEAVMEPATATMSATGSAMPSQTMGGGMGSGSGSMPSATGGMPEQSTGGAGSLLPVMGGVVGGAMAAVLAL
ncbi:hypothetical protein CB0940_00338 [Cercospora beticola]|uniref:Uncharacterized protein n=1 Tax=Cercospora beticola TaxID=122368 RepID=A0A2G5I788_CERBT|nr:hypothetical protein CB0940_00338 [Cercospora beticola]PIB00661.1 hypothetical protein CB0940_00338 [Cercospora beticola]WPA95750.1 hypothetical protein RHO25_000353 [Cercospora beticola]CAK1356001.1 unnamed protein product [Cercospora beticola]